jgi:hypothetical protein
LWQRILEKTKASGRGTEMPVRIQVRDAASEARREVVRISREMESLSKYPSSEDLAKHLKALTKALDRFFSEVSAA